MAVNTEFTDSIKTVVASRSPSVSASRMLKSPRIRSIPACSTDSIILSKLSFGVPKLVETLTLL